MSKDSIALHYETLGAFRKHYYSKLLNKDNLVPGEKYFKKVIDQDGENYELNKYVYILEKDGIKYMLPSEYKDKLPLVVVHKVKYAYEGTAYYYLSKIKSAAFTSYRAMSFRNFVDKLSCFKHSSSKQYTLLWLMALTGLIDKANFRVSTPPGFGKDNIIQILNHLFGGANSIVSPTVAKLEYMTSSDLLAVNEVVDIAPEQYNLICQFLLDTGDMKMETTKRSRATKGVNEILDLKDFSLILYYNDINCYPQKSDKYFDMVTKKAILDRFPAFRFYGVLQENFNTIKDVDVQEFVVENKKLYESLIRSFTYYKSNYMKELNGWKCSETFDFLSERGRGNVGKLLRFVDLYCTSQDEFDEWVIIVKDSLLDYDVMLEYPSLVIQCEKKRINLSTIENYIKDESFTFVKKEINNFLVDKKSSMVGNSLSGW